MKKFFVFSIMVMVMAMAVSCGKDDIMDSVSRSSVQPTVVTDTVVNVDTVFVPQVDTLVIDSTTPGQTRLVLDKHLDYGQWSGTGATRTITATHELKTIIIPDGGTPFTADSVVFNEVGTMVWSFQPVYTTSIDGPHAADENGCPSLGATCTFNWEYQNVPAEYAPYFEGDCEMWPTQVVGNGTTATVVTKNGNTGRTATYTVNVDIPTPDSTVVSRNATWRHLSDCGQWSGTGATRTITIHCWCVESTTWSTGTVTKDSVLVPYTGTMTWSFPTYNTSQDGNYNANGNGCTGLNATCNIVWTPGTANIQGRTYVHNNNCSLTPDSVYVTGTTATVVTKHGNVRCTATYTLTINTPVPMDTIHLNGILAWYFESDGYYTATTNQARRYGFVVMTNGDVYSILRRVTSYNSNGTEISHTDYPLTAANFQFERTLTTSEFNGMETQANNGRAIAKGFHHSSSSHTYDLTMVSLESGLVSYWTFAGSFHSSRDVIGGTTAAVTTVNPVHRIENASSVVVDGKVVTGN